MLFDGAFAGLVGFRDTDSMNRKTEIGYWLSEPIITRARDEGCTGVDCIAFEELGMNRGPDSSAVASPSRSLPHRLAFSLRVNERRVVPDAALGLEVYRLLKQGMS
jgi:ribosomal-protein-serine acetyltransferase